MPLGYRERDHAYRKRLLVLSPLSVLIVLILFATSDVIPYREIERHLGWRGPLKILPEITIVPDEDPFETFIDEQLRGGKTALVAYQLEEAGQEKAGRAQTEVPREAEKKEPSREGKSIFEAHPVHTDIPYSEDYVILRMVKPQYPPEELAQGVEGEVTLEILVNAEGKVEKAWVLSTIGPRSFEEASLKAVRQFLFAPPLKDGKPVSMAIRFVFKFRIVG